MSTLDDKMEDVLRAISADLDEVFKDLIQEVTNLRHKVSGEGDIDDDPRDIHAQLLDARKSTDRVEELVGFVQRVYTTGQRQLAARKAELEDAEIAASQGQTSLGDDYSTAKEKNTALMSRTIDQRIAVRKAERRLLVLQEVLDYVRHCYRGLNESRRDLGDRIRLITLQSQLEK